MKTWKDCEYYQEMYELKYTWGEIKCDQDKIDKPPSCKDCPLSISCKSEDMKDYRDSN